MLSVSSDSLVVVLRLSATAGSLFTYRYDVSYLWTAKRFGLCVRIKKGSEDFSEHFVLPLFVVVVVVVVIFEFIVGTYTDRSTIGRLATNKLKE